jgi:enoyl-CoA hydratase/carnithine racemase
MLKLKSMLGAMTISLAATTAFAGDVRIMWYSDGVEGEVMADLVGRFMKENPGINVILDNVAYKVIQEQLPVELEAGRGPDIARVTNIKALASHWLDLTPHIADKAYWQANFGDQFDWMRPDGSEIIPGFMTQLTLTGGFANKTLFEQAGVALPGEKATWDEWVEAAGKVQDSQKLNAAFAIDRSGHRISGPNVSFGANYIGPERLPAPIDAGTKAFAAGADISEFANFNVEKGTQMSADGHDVMNTIEDGHMHQWDGTKTKFVVAAVNGYALGGGCELAMACHMRIASSNAKFGQPEVNLGVPPGYGGTQRLIQLIGKGRALEMLLTGDAIDAQTALNYGLVTKVVDQAELLTVCREVVKKVASKSPSAVHKILKCVSDFYRPNVNGMQREIYEFGSAFSTEDFSEGTDAFLNKRKAEFKR